MFYLHTVYTLCLHVVCTLSARCLHAVCMHAVCTGYLHISELDKAGSLYPLCTHTSQRSLRPQTEAVSAAAAQQRSIIVWSVARGHTRHVPRTPSIRVGPLAPHWPFTVCIIMSVTTDVMARARPPLSPSASQSAEAH